jgi:hypothetical protein
MSATKMRVSIALSRVHAYGILCGQAMSGARAQSEEERAKDLRRLMRKTFLGDLLVGSVGPCEHGTHRAKSV